MGDRLLPWLTQPVVYEDAWEMVTEKNINSSRYGRALADALGLSNARMLTYNPTAPPRRIPLPKDFPNARSHLLRRGTLELPAIDHDPTLTLVDWGRDDAIALALPHALSLVRNSCVASDLFQVPAHTGPITCVSWAPQSPHLAVALADSEVQLWDAQAARLLRTLGGDSHTDYVSSMAWRDPHCIVTGGADGLIDSNDMRVPAPEQFQSSGHEAPVCGLRFAADGVLLASGDEDGVVSTWDFRRHEHCRMLEGHQGPVKALTWCPFDSRVLVTGGGDGDGRIKFWDADTGRLEHAIATRSDVWGLEWNMQDRALLSAHGKPRGMLLSWRYSTKFRLQKMLFQDESGQWSPISCMTSSPDRHYLATLRAQVGCLDLWNVVGTNPSPATAPKRQAASASRAGIPSLSTRFDYISFQPEACPEAIKEDSSIGTNLGDQPPL